MRISPLDTGNYDANETHRMQELQGATLASFSRRAIAFAIDFLLANLLFIPVALLVIQALLFFGVPSSRINIQVGFFDNWYSIVWLVLYFGLATWFGKGATPGKRLLRIRAVSLIHGRISLWHSIERALGYAASALELGFGFLQYFIHPNRRTVHDRIAETIVVDERPPKKSREDVVAAERG